MWKEKDLRVISIFISVDRIFFPLSFFEIARYYLHCANGPSDSYILTPPLLSHFIYLFDFFLIDKLMVLHPDITLTEHDYLVLM